MFNRRKMYKSGIIDESVNSAKLVPDSADKALPIGII